MIEAVATLMFLIACIICFVLFLKWITEKKSPLMQKTFSWIKIKTDEHPLSIEQTLMLDTKRRIVVVRHKKEEYVLLLGFAHETLLKGPYTIEDDQNRIGEYVDIQE